MKICKQCNATLAEDARFCNQCGAVLENTEKLEVTAEAVVEPAQEPKKKPWGWIIGMAAAVVLIVVLILVRGNADTKPEIKPEEAPQVSTEVEQEDESQSDVEAETQQGALHTNAYGYESYSIHFTNNDDGSTAYSYMNENGELVSMEPEVVDELLDQVVASTGNMELTNRDLQYIYEQQYYYFYNTYGNYIPYIMDTSIGLDEQVDMESGDTWQKFFLESSVEMFHQVAAMYQAAAEEGFVLTEEQQAQLDSSLDISALAANYGYTDMNLFMKDFFGPFATVESYQDFIRMNTIVNQYVLSKAESVTVTPEELDAYYDANAQMLQQTHGIQKVDKNVIDVRHILIQPAAGEDGSISDEAWAEAEAEAQRIYEEWLAGEATEETFAEYAIAYSVDGGSTANGGLYEDVYPGQMVIEFNDWCFDDNRQVGDHGIVKTTYGYHIMFFSGVGDYVFWEMQVEDLYRQERAVEICNEIVEGYALQSDLTKAMLLDITAPTVPAAETEGTTEE